ncbi:MULTISPECIES: glycoside hydrolase family 3 N-terminal domain-containing protein [unclassified Rathayibacter]|uniref:beta-xylosidase/alpha-l-arabinosidase n=1 Tax=unclassified Rathayibacter TaxID=2609250 RepID=UPI000CE72DEF|nr:MULTISPECIES: glycoside hydrolase family 3 N-terminal domain-containing protein [unclassified Rathayibacter]PPG81532.1 glycosyl hydrolase [Rathayibacter sp. AY1E5]PPH32212.1 glycosyl hydrolase [Rathayibacter sp. AY1C3]PPH66318.1 glycosyl hydrolase [Rathayibacter sp. AY1D7]PPI31262.1 glycosyl hydrolase [Rathayibacter sp. AY1B4]
MTLEEKLSQLVGYWVDQGGEVVAPLAGEMATSTGYAEATREGIGQLTRVYGTRPVDPLERARWLWAEQRRIVEETRLGIPAIVHEECLTGLAAWQAATFPTPLAWGASFDPELVAELGAVIGGSMRELGIHQGLAPVLDVIRDPRWGRVDECIAEDPYVVGTIGTAYVQGLQSTGVDATLKHFIGYSASRGGRNHAPVHAGPREIADVLLPPFEMAIRDGGARSVMNSYAEIDGDPVGATPAYLTGVLRERWGFDGVVVADYFSVAFLHLMHAVAADLGEAAELALAAGIDVELPTGDAFLAPLAARIRAGEADEALVDRAVLRVLAQKERLGLLDARFDDAPESIDLDSPAHRDIARRLAEESVVLLANDGVLPLAAPRRLALIGPNADSAPALMGCYSFANHVLAHHPGVPLGFEIPTVADALADEFGSAELLLAEGCSVEGDDVSGIAEAVRAAADSDVAIMVVGDRAGLFGRGTVGEGNDVESLELPGRQRELVEAVVATGTPVVLVLLTGRPYAVGWALDGPSAPAAVLQAFFPGEEGAGAIAGVVSGRVDPSGHLPVSLPRSAGAQPFSYLHPILGGPSDVTSADSTPVRPFGHGLSYTTFARTELAVEESAPTDGSFTATVRVRNTGERAGTDLVQLYARDVFASVTRPVAQLLGYARVALEPGEEAEVRFEVPAARLAFTGREGVRIVEPGRVELWVGPDCATRETEATLELVGPAAAIDASSQRLVGTRVQRAGAGVPA